MKSKIFKILLNISVFKFIKIILNPNIKGRILPYRGTILSLAKSSKIKIGKLLQINSNKLKGSKRESYITIEENAKLEIKNHFNIYYGADICIFKNAKLEIGSGFMNAGSQIRCKKGIKIGNNVAISRGVTIWDTDAHGIIYEDGNESIKTKQVSIGNNVWIGNNAIILKGVNIGDNVIIGAGTIVNKDIPSNYLVAGNPARLIKKIRGWK